MFKNLALSLALLALGVPAWGAGNDSLLAAAEAGRAHPVAIGLRDGTIPQFVDGDSWQTTLVLTNLVNTPVYYQIFFKNDNGATQAFNFVGQGNQSTLTGTLAVGQTVEFATVGTGAALVQGYARMLNFDRPATDPAAVLTESRAGGYAIFRRKLGTQAAQEAVVPLADPLEQRFTIPFDNRNGFISGIAIVNDTTQSGTLNVTARDYSGNVLLTESVAMAAGTKQVYQVPLKYPALANRAGVLEYSISTIGLSGLGLRFNPEGSFTSTHPLRY
jgi:hypothetical protein